MRQLAAQNIAEDLGVAMRICWKPGSGGYAIFIEDAEAVEVIESRVVVCVAEYMVRIQLAVASVSLLARTARDHFGVSESFRNSVFGCRGIAYGVWC